MATIADPAVTPSAPRRPRSPLLHFIFRLFREKRCVMECRERGDPKPAALPLENAERRGADRPSRSEDGDAAPRIVRAHVGTHVSMKLRSTNAVGRTNSRLSKRSRTPP